MIGALAMAGCVKDMDQPAQVQSDYLVIEAACTPATKTDMVQGQSAWEKGDKITVTMRGKVKGSVSSSAFDGDGVTLVDKTVIENGKAVSLWGGNVPSPFSGNIQSYV